MVASFARFSRHGTALMVTTIALAAACTVSEPGGRPNEKAGGAGSASPGSPSKSGGEQAGTGGGTPSAAATPVAGSAGAEGRADGGGTGGVQNEEIGGGTAVRENPGGAGTGAFAGRAGDGTGGIQNEGAAGAPILFDPPGSGDLCEQRFGISLDSVSAEIPYCANVDLDAPGPLDGITHVLFVIHASERTARDHFARAHAAAQLAGEETTTAIIAPQFLAEPDIATWGLGDTHLRWTETSWSSGSFSVDCETCPPQLSSYDVLDRMAARLLANADLKDLESIVFVGHSAGGQFVNRYAATSPFETDRATVRYVATAPSSFVYFSGLRPELPLVDQFSLPDAEALAACPEYNDYRHGLDELYSYMKDLGAEGIRERYAPRLVHYLVGSEDDDPNDEGLSTSCPSLLQGTQRLERMLAYMHHLDQEFGPSVAQQRYAIVPGVGHSSADLYTSDCGTAAIFGVTPASCAFLAPGM